MLGCEFCIKRLMQLLEFRVRLRKTRIITFERGNKRSARLLWCIEVDA